MRNVPSVMMKLGRPVRVTSQPLKKPDRQGDDQRDADGDPEVLAGTRRRRCRPSAPSSRSCTPADRSKWPPIISSATATAMMPSVDAGSSQLATPARRAEDRRLDREEREDDDRADQRPELGLDQQPAQRPARGQPLVGRRSAGTGRAGARDAQRVPAEARSAISSTLSVFDDARAGEDRLAAADGVQVLRVELQHHDRQVALLVLLLVDGEGDLAVLDALDDVGVEVEGGDLGLGPGVLRRR